MYIEIFSLCDAATVDVAGKLNLLGAFDTIFTASMPLVYPLGALALRIRFDAIERGSHKVSVNFVDLDGKHVIPPANGTVNINFPDEQGSGSINLVFNLQMLKLEKYGQYAIDLAVDSRKEASLPLFVKEKSQHE